jgi:hypothetical protein
MAMCSGRAPKSNGGRCGCAVCRCYCSRPQDERTVGPWDSAVSSHFVQKVADDGKAAHDAGRDEWRAVVARLSARRLPTHYTTPAHRHSLSARMQKAPSPCTAIQASGPPGGGGEARTVHAEGRAATKARTSPSFLVATNLTSCLVCACTFVILAGHCKKNLALFGFINMP